MLSNTEIQQLIAEVDAGTYDLSDALNDIAVAQKGEDVRKALYAEAYTLNKEGKVGAVDIVVRNQMDQFVASHSGTQLETTLWEDINGAGVYGAEITLSDYAHTFDYIDVYYYPVATSDSARVFTFSGEGFKTGIMKFDGISLQLVTSGGAPVPEGALMSGSISLRPASTTNPDGKNYVIASAVAWEWDGGANTAAGGESATSNNLVAGVIKRIAGRRLKSDAEVEDIRNGQDGIEYATAGNAVRAQLAKKVSMPEDNYAVDDGTAGQFLMTNGDGTTQWADVDPDGGTCVMAYGNAFEEVNGYSAVVGKIAHVDLIFKPKQTLTAGGSYIVGTISPKPAGQIRLKAIDGNGAEHACNFLSSSSSNVTFKPSVNVANTVSIYVSATYTAS